jgi:hypothetical protein
MALQKKRCICIRGETNVFYRIEHPETLLLCLISPTKTCSKAEEEPQVPQWLQVVIFI